MATAPYNTSGYVAVLNDIPFTSTWTYTEMQRGPNYHVVTSMGPWNSMQPDFDVSHYETMSIVEIDLPGVSKDSIKISYDHDKKTLLFSGEYTRKVQDGVALYGNRPSGKFNQSAYVGKHVELEHATAKFDNGVLTVVLPYKITAPLGSIQVK